MSTWTPQDWALFLTAVGTLVSAVFAAAAAFMATLAKLRTEKASRQIDENTQITREGTLAAAKDAKVAATAAAAVQAMATETKGVLVEKLNGGIDAAIEKVLGASKEHLADLADRVEKLETYNRDASHRLLGAVNAVNAQVSAIAAVQIAMAPPALQSIIKSPSTPPGNVQWTVRPPEGHAPAEGEQGAK